MKVNKGMCPVNIYEGENGYVSSEYL